MKPLILVFIISGYSLFANAQYQNGFPYGKIISEEFRNSINQDTSASAIILDEFGEAYIVNGGENNLLLEYHVKIKILTTRGLDQANFEISFRKGERSKETIRSIEGVTYNIVNNSITTTRFDSRKVFSPNLNQFRDAYMFTMPAVIVGSINEV
jgi:hypothetical protein